MVKLGVNISSSIGVTWIVFLSIVDSNIQLAASFSHLEVSRGKNIIRAPSFSLRVNSRNNRICAKSDIQDEIGDEQSPKNENRNISRRRLLTNGVKVSSVSLLLGSSPSPSHAEMDSKFTFRTNNLPKKYEGTSMTSSYSYPNQDCTETPEMKRMNVFERASPSVVYIDTFVEQRDAFSPNVMEIPLGTGSGFIWDDKGHIVTNFHVIRSAQTAQVAILTKVFPDDDDNTKSTKQNKGSGSSQQASKELDPNLTQFKRKMYKAKVVGVDPGKDIAVLKVDAPVFDLYPIDVGTSTGLKVGQTALAIGNPFGLDHTLTSGIISGIGREVKSPIGRPISNVIQTDAPINPGNSGGPLLDSNGKLIGMNTSIFSPSGASAGIGFAIPVDTVKYIVETLIRDGKVVRPIIGISFMQSTQARALGINKGVLVLDVPQNSPAAKAGLRGTRRTESGLIEIGDIIVKIDDMTITTESDLFEALESYAPGDVVSITVNRPEYEGPNSTKLKVKAVTLKVKLQGRDDVPTSRIIISP